MTSSKNIDVFVARQPILAGDETLYGYQLQFRSGPQDLFAEPSPDTAASRVIADSASVFGLESLTGGKPAFIDITRRVLTEDLYTFLPADRVVLSLPEGLGGDEEVVKACGGLRRSGYALALDGFAGLPRSRALIEIASYARVDFHVTDTQERRRIAKAHGNDLRLIGENVESSAEFREGRDLGFQLFQGFFFCEPEIVSRKDVAPFKLNYLSFMREMARPELDFGEVAEIIEREVSLTVKLLRLLNSAALGLGGRANSVRDALILLGERTLRKWAAVIAVGEMAEDRPTALVLMCLIRARFCELLARPAGLDRFEHDLFLVGMLSLVDALVGRPLDELLQELAVSDEIRAGLLEKDSRFGRVLALVVAHERGEWEQITALAAELDLPESAIPGPCAAAVEWAMQVFHL